MSVDALAGPTGTHAPSLYRLMRTLASFGILTEDVTHRLALTPLCEALKAGAPGATILTIANGWWVRGFGHLQYSLQTGKSGFEKSLGMPIFDWLAKNPVEASMFSETMVGVHGEDPPAVAAAYDFSGLETIVDVGGSTGNLLTTILGGQCPRRESMPCGKYFGRERIPCRCDPKPTSPTRAPRPGAADHPLPRRSFTI